MTAEGLRKALSSVSKDEVGMFVFCDPNNPMGNIVGEDEWKKIIQILECYPGIQSFLMRAMLKWYLINPHKSLMSYSPENIQNRIILLRSATKGFSVSGERMAILVCKNRMFMDLLSEYRASQAIHAPKSAQYAYTYAMEKLT